MTSVIKLLQQVFSEISDSELLDERRCIYCGDSEFDPHPCRAGYHSFESTGERYYIVEESLIKKLELILAQQKADRKG